MTFSNKFTRCFITAIPTTRKTTAWLLKLMIPISFCVTMMQYSGVLEWLSGYLDPLFRFLGLPGCGAVIFVSGAFAGTYAGLAAMMTVELTMRQATILGIMICICHALPMECAVNKKTGSSFWKMGAIRFVMAFVCALYLNTILPEMQEKYIYLGAQAESSFAETLGIWAMSQLKVCIAVALIIYSLMVVQRLLEAYSLLRPIGNFFAPLMALFGLPRQAAYMWIVGNVLGISYGSAVMIELQEKGMITREDSNAMNYHLIMNHSMIEDTLVFCLTGIPALLIISTRMLFAIVLVWARRVIIK